MDPASFQPIGAQLVVAMSFVTLLLLLLGNFHYTVGNRHKSVVNLLMHYITLIVCALVAAVFMDGVKNIVASSNPGSPFGIAIVAVLALGVVLMEIRGVIIICKSIPRNQ